MVNMTKSVTLSATTDATRMDLFGPPALLKGEDAAAYHALSAQIAAAIKPADFLEEIWARDVTDLTWDILRLRRLKTRLLNANVHRGLKDVLEPMCRDIVQADTLARDWALGDEDAIEKVEQFLSVAGFTMTEVQAETLAVKIHDVECIDRMIMSAEARRNAVLRELERHRASREAARRQRADDVEDAQFVELDDPTDDGDENA